MNEDDPLEQLKALKKQQGGTVVPHTDPLEQLKAMKQPQPPSQDGAGEGVLDRFLNMATLGLHPKIQGLGTAAVDLLTHGTGAHPIQSYEEGVQGTKQRMEAASTQHPYASSGADATAFFGTLAAEAPLRAAIAARTAASKGLQMLPAAVDYAEGAPGFGAAIKRIGGAAKTGAATGAVVGGLSSDGSPSQRASAIGAGGVLGGLFGGGAQTLGETGGGLKSLIQNLRTPASELGEQAANSRLAGKLGQDQIDPTDLFRNARQAQETGSPALLAHIGGPSLDNTTWLATTGPSAEAARLKQAIIASKGQESGLLNRGLRTAANVGNKSAYQAESDIANQQALSAHKLYGIAENAAPIHDPEIAKAIIQEPELLNAMARTVKSFGESATPDELKAVQSLAYAKNILDRNPNANISPFIQPIPLRLLNETKKEADATIHSLASKSPNFTQLDKRRIQSALSNILSRADAQSPEFAQARTVFKNDADRQAALSAGLDLTKRQPEEIAGHVSGIKPLTPESAYPSELLPQNVPDYQLGGIEALNRGMAEKGPQSNLTKQFFTSSADEERLKALLGNEGAQQFAPYKEQANTLNRVYEAATGNSKTAERQGTQGEVVDQRAIDAAHLLTSPHRAFYNIPQKLADERNKKINQVMLQALARKLQIPANSPELPGLVEQLLQAQATPAGRDVTATLGRRGAIARGGGILSGLLSGGATQ